MYIYTSTLVLLTFGSSVELRMSPFLLITLYTGMPSFSSGLMNCNVSAQSIDLDPGKLGFSSTANDVFCGPPELTV